MFAKLLSMPENIKEQIKNFSITTTNLRPTQVIGKLNLIESTHLSKTLLVETVESMELVSKLILISPMMLSKELNKMLQDMLILELRYTLPKSMLDAVNSVAFLASFQA